jgi:hypothetical protein
MTVIGYPTKTTNYTLLTTDQGVRVDASGGNRTMTLPLGALGQLFTIKKVDSSANTVTIQGTSGQTIDDAATVVLTKENQSVTVVGNASGYDIGETHRYPLAPFLNAAGNYELTYGDLEFSNGSILSGASVANIKSYGATGDGTTNDYAAIQSALDDAASAGGGTIFCPLGIYKTNSTLEIHSDTLLVGAGWATVIKSTAAIPIIRAVATTDLTRGIGIENLTVDGGAIGNGGTGIYITKQVGGGPTEAGRNNWIKNFHVTNCGTGIKTVMDQGITLASGRVHGNGVGLDISDDSQLGLVSNVDFRANTVAGTKMVATGAIIAEAPDLIYGWKFDRCHWESNSGKGLVLDGATYNTFDTCKWEANTGTYVEMDDAVSGFRCDGNVFINGTWNGTVATPTVKQLDLQAADSTLFFGGQFNPGNTSGIVIGAGAYHTVFFFTNITAGAIADTSGYTYIFSPGYGLQEWRLESGLPFKFRAAGGGVAASVDGTTGVDAVAHVIGDRGLYSGAGSPEGVKTARIGSIYMRTDGGAGTSMYVKESGTGSAGWVPK